MRAGNQSRARRGLKMKDRFLVPLAILGCLSLAGSAAAQVRPWNRIEQPEGGDVRALVIDPQTPTAVYAGTFSDGVFKSTDGGGNWTAASGGLTTLGVRALALDPLTPTTLYAGTGGGVFTSTDGGGSWSATSAGLTSLDVLALAVDPLTPTTL